jgi:FlaG/FlaF family flagellin (archaellin)
MQNKVVAVLGAAFVVVGMSACASERITPARTARVTVDGDSQTVQIVCSHLQEFWTINVGNEAAGLEATVVYDGTTIKPQWVKIRNFGGFTGSVWKGGVGNADASLSGGTFTIDGTAYGVSANNPKPATTNFKIIADCR